MTPRTAHTTRRDKAQIAIAFAMSLAAVAIAFEERPLMAGLPFEADFVIERKPAPPQPATFVCTCCERTVQPDRWNPARQRAPICAVCEVSWSSAARPAGLTRGDLRMMRRLSAITTRLEWETINGRRVS